MVTKPSFFPEAINPELPSEDFLYHLWFDRHGNGLYDSGYPVDTTLTKLFEDVTHVCMGGSAVRAERFADTLTKEKYWNSNNTPTSMPIGKTERFSLYKVWNVISVNHGMGMPSMSILLHEITKILYYAKWCDEQRLRNEVKFIRIGTSGWIGVEGGTVVMTENAKNPKGEAIHTEIILGEDFDFPTRLDSKLIGEIQAANIEQEVWEKIQLVLWDTVGTHDFYEWQGRLDGFFAPWYTETDKQKWLKKLYVNGVRNFEMESTYFASFCLRAGIPGAIVCVALLNRFEGDQVKKDLNKISENAEKIILNYLRKTWALL